MRRALAALTLVLAAAAPALADLPPPGPLDGGIGTVAVMGGVVVTLLIVVLVAVGVMKKKKAAPDDSPSE